MTESKSPDDGEKPDREPDGDSFQAVHVLPFLRYAWHRFGQDRCMSMASSLSYTSLLAIVPLTAIAFAMLAAFPVFEGVREQFQSMLFSNFLPQSAEAMREYFDGFVRNTAKLTAVGIIGLALTAILLLGTIESHLNSIFRVARPRDIVPRLLVFWALITLGPLLLGASFSLSTYFFAMTRWVGVEENSIHFGYLVQATPTIIVIVALWLFFVIIPNRPVRLSHGLVGAVVGGLLFSLLRHVFGWYVATFPAYQTIYGAVSVVPIFLVWMYLSWTVVLLGAELTAAMGEWRASNGHPYEGALRSGRLLVAVLSVMARLSAAQQKGGSISRGEFLQETGLGERSLEGVLELLRGAGFVEKTAKGRWMAGRDLGAVGLSDLIAALDMYLTMPEDMEISKPWHHRVLGITQAGCEAQRACMDVSLKELLAEEDRKP